MKKGIIVGICLMLLATGVLSGCTENEQKILKGKIIFTQQLETNVYLTFDDGRLFIIEANRLHELLVDDIIFNRTGIFTFERYVLSDEWYIKDITYLSD